MVSRLLFLSSRQGDRKEIGGWKGDPGLGLDTLPLLQKLWVTVGSPHETFPESIRTIERMLTPCQPTGMFPALSSFVIVIASSLRDTGFKDVHITALQKLIRHFLANQATFPCLKKFVICFARVSEHGNGFQIQDEDAAWTDGLPLLEWKPVVLEALQPLQAIGIEASDRWMTYRRGIWRAGLRDIIV